MAIRAEVCCNFPLLLAFIYPMERLAGPQMPARLVDTSASSLATERKRERDDVIQGCYRVIYRSELCRLADGEVSLVLDC